MLAGKEPRGSPRVALGAKVLNALPDQQTCRILLGWFLEKNYTCTFPKAALIDLANSLWTTYAQELAEPRCPEDLEAVSSILCKTAETAVEEFEDYDRWYVACSGANLRWEMLGQVFGALTTAVLSLPEKDPFFASQRGERRSRRNFSIELKDCVQACITLSNYMDLINVGMVGLLLKNLILQTVISGDVSKCSVISNMSWDTIDKCHRLGCLETARRSCECQYGVGTSPPDTRTTNYFHLRNEEAHVQYDFFF